MSCKPFVISNMYIMHGKITNCIQFAYHAHFLDVNECALGKHNCDANANCTDTIGSYMCACNIGYEGDGFNCTSETHSFEGLTNGLVLNCMLTCIVDINECAKGTDDCHEDSTCTDTDGSYYCTCEVGFVGDGFNCTSMLLSLQSLFNKYLF